jgi:oligopeptide/dipeptide ABC transporter ATP-binding protein
VTRPILSVQRLGNSFAQKHGWLLKKRVEILKNICFDMTAGDIFCLIGESGSGKSTLINCIMGLNRIQTGAIYFKGALACNPNGPDAPGFKQLRDLTQLVFQSPAAALSPHMTLKQSIEEALLTFPAEQRRSIAMEKAAMADLDTNMLARYPFQVSGGQKQRVCIARALCSNPELIVLDEPLASLDLLSKHRIADLLINLNQKEKITLFMVSHDLAIVKRMATKITVIYMGCIMESAPAEIFFAGPCHPYSRVLLSSALEPWLWPASRVKPVGEIPSFNARPKGCPFHPRCPEKKRRCTVEFPEPVQPGRNHLVFCHGVSP